MKHLKIIFVVLLLLSACSQQKGTYPSQIIWDGIIYAVYAETVQSKDIGEEIGEIKKKGKSDA